ncbi:MAG: type II secretion system protein GspE, partial [Candidatus Dadabacteria bacterium]
LVLRILDTSQVILDLEQLGVEADTMERWRTLIRRPHGIILVTGPTGSGKTTTLYASLSEINSPDKNILTIEDPVEYQLQGIGQMNVNPKIDLTFASGLRTILRQDPDVILVGEIRDLETAEIAIQASLTGHLVFSTLHTNDAPGAVTRLVDMGVEPFLVASSLMAVSGQRLVRKICPDCRTPVEVPAAALREIGLTVDDLPEGTVFEGAGCERCMGTGYKGRIAINELMLISERIRSMITQNKDSGAIRKVAVGEGMRGLREDGARKVARGLTTISEVLRVTQEDLMDQ